MPTIYKRRYQKKAPVEKLSDDQMQHLIYGWGLDSEQDVKWADGTVAPFADRAAMRAAWRRHRQQVIAAARVDPAYDRAAPFAFWEFEAPEPRKQLSGPSPLTELPATESCFCRDCTLHLGLVYGIPNAWRNYEECAAAVFEDEESYLARLGYDPVTLKAVKP